MAPLTVFSQQASSFPFPPLAEYASQVTYQRLQWPALSQRDVHVYLRRDDLASEFYPGNKFYKLYYHLQQFYQQRKTALVSFGGAFSNHIHALAALGKHCNIPVVGIIRGPEPKNLSPTLQDAVDWGMQLVFVSREDYRAKRIDYLDSSLRERVGDYYLIPEGGESIEGVRGCQVLGQAIADDCERFEWKQPIVCCAAGTGTTLAGIAAGLPQSIPCIGFSVLKGKDTITPMIRAYLDRLGCRHDQWQFINDYHCGGYAKAPAFLLEFMQALEGQNQLLLEPVYSAKMLWGIQQMADNGCFASGTQIIAIHGGGVQGRRGFPHL